MPLLVLNHAGEGRIAQLMSDHIWLWARGIEGGGPYQELLRRSVHWLMKEPDLEETALEATADGDEIRIERRSLMPEQTEVTVEAPDGTRRTVTLTPDADGLARATISAPDPGLYRVFDTEDEAVVGTGLRADMNCRKSCPPIRSCGIWRRKPAAGFSGWRMACPISAIHLKRPPLLARIGLDCPSAMPAAPMRSAKGRFCRP